VTNAPFAPTLVMRMRGIDDSVLMSFGKNLM
jgi:hypothetical protein